MITRQIRHITVLSLLLLLPTYGRSQTVNAGVLTMHDENVFDTYAPIKDQVTALNLNASKDWDFDQSNIALAYYGSLLLYNDLGVRNYNIHSLFLNTFYHFQKDDEDGEETESDSTSDGEDSASTGIQKPDPPAPDPAQHSDSLDQYLYGLVAGTSQFNKTEFSEYDNAGAAASVIFRQPVGATVSLRPGYTFSYHLYQNLQTLTNVQHTGSVTLGLWLDQLGWIGVTGSYGHKIYTQTSSYTFTFNDSVPGSNGYGHEVGHGKGNSGSPTAGKSRTLTYNFTSPSVDQASIGVAWHKTFSRQTDMNIEFTAYATPSTTARLIPERVQNEIETHPGSFQDITTESEIFDDHFTYSGPQVLVQLRQKIPFDISLEVDGMMKQKTFTSPATSLAGDTIASNRDDQRYETALIFTRPIPVITDHPFTLTVEFHYIRNMSNEPFYDFDKTVILAGLEFVF